MKMRVFRDNVAFVNSSRNELVLGKPMIKWLWRLARITRLAEDLAPKTESGMLDDQTIRGKRALRLRRTCQDQMRSWYKSSRYSWDCGPAPEDHPELAEALRGSRMDSWPMSAYRSRKQSTAS